MDYILGPRLSPEIQWLTSAPTVEDFRPNGSKVALLQENINKFIQLKIRPNLGNKDIGVSGDNLRNGVAGPGRGFAHGGSVDGGPGSSPFWGGFS